MSSLSLIARSDTHNRVISLAGDRWIDLQIAYDRNDPSKHFSIRVNFPNETKKATLWIDTEKAKEVNTDGI